ncbi:MAG TPA: hypothetical protein VL418_16720, partial [Devosiaceae bacterium]|nr:hypothetical protein [Devosiaceae bacterium]
MPGLIDLSRANDAAGAAAYSDAKLKPFDQANEASVQQLFNINRVQGEDGAATSDRLQATIKLVTLGAGIFAVLASIGCAFAIISSISRGIGGLLAPQGRLAGGDLSVEIPMRGDKSELGRIADTVDVLKQGLILAGRLEQEKQSAQQHAVARAALVAELQTEIATIVEAGVEGDFSRRIERNFAVASLDEFAQSVNSLVATVDDGLAESSRVLAMIARAELGGPGRGAVSGRFHQCDRAGRARKAAARPGGPGRHCGLAARGFGRANPRQGEHR